MEELPDENSLTVQEKLWFVDIANYKATSLIHNDLNGKQTKRILCDSNQCVWNDPYLFKIGVDNLLRRCVTMEEARSIIWHCHNSSYGYHYNGERTTVKVSQFGFFWHSQFKDTHEHAYKCKKIAKGSGDYLNKMRYPYKICLKWKYLIVLV